MKIRIFCACGMVALTTALLTAQTKTTMSGKCTKPDVQQSIPAGNMEGHAFTLAQGKCTVSGDVNGMAGKTGSYSEHGEVTPTRMRAWGVYTVTFDNGDKIYYEYQAMGSMKNGVLETETNKYQIAGGTGKMKGLKGSGSCNLTGSGDGGADYSCTGELASGGTMAKP